MVYRDRPEIWIDHRPLLQEAIRQLHEEADQRCEARYLRNFATLLQDSPQFLVPGADEDLSRKKILALGLLGGAPVESLTTATRQHFEARPV